MKAITALYQSLRSIEKKSLKWWQFFFLFLRAKDDREQRCSLCWSMTDHGIIDNDKSEDSQCKKSSDLSLSIIP